ncbi:hypothetical protein TEA_000797 [Camellia sinensis var. sinensis]|uniref:Sulfotransferase n=1 Tax=Camellia sinensis var. sinensis TaxID=542762 RepID=A0A4S4DR56_CAMSN|nr:hypothetical protein TEA_000797 [Camellia sinensis var. sinensis]
MFCGITTAVRLFVCKGQRIGMMFMVLLDKIVAVFSLDFSPNTERLLATTPKAGTTWLKALSYGIVNRNKYALAESPLLTANPHELVPFFDWDFYANNPTPNLEDTAKPRIFSTHAPYATLPDSIKDSRYRITQTRESISLDEDFDMFCRVIKLYGPFWDHVLGYWKASQEMVDKILFMKYEDMKGDTMSSRASHLLWRKRDQG